APDQLKRFALLLVRPLVDEDAHRGFGLATPDVADEVRHPQEIEPIEGDIAVVALANVVRQDPITVAEGWGLRERAGTGNIAFADVEPVADDVPGGYRCHREVNFLSSCAYEP